MSGAVKQMLIHLKTFKRQRVFRFLTGLHQDYDGVTKIPTKILPSPKTLFCEIRYRVEEK